MAYIFDTLKEHENFDGARLATVAILQMRGYPAKEIAWKKIYLVE